MSPIDLSIVIPAYMEASRIQDTLQRLADYLDAHDFGEVEVIVATAQSADNTREVALAQASRFKHFRVLDLGKKAGKGRDVRLGMFEANGAYRLFMDADLATPLHHLEDAWQLMQQGAPIGIAVRDVRRIHHQPLRIIMSVFGNLLAQAVLLPSIRDTQCGFKFFSAEATQAIFGRQTLPGWGFDLEVLAIARSLNYPIATISTPDWTDPKDDEEGFVGDSALGAALKTFGDLFYVRWGLWTGRYRKISYQHSPVE